MATIAFIGTAVFHPTDKSHQGEAKQSTTTNAAAGDVVLAYDNTKITTHTQLRAVVMSLLQTALGNTALKP